MARDRAGEIAAASVRNWERAEEHFDTALRQAQAFPHQLEMAEVSRFRAAMLLDRAARGDLDRARNLLNEALIVYSRIGMPRHGEMVSSMLAGLPL